MNNSMYQWRYLVFFWTLIVLSRAEEQTERHKTILIYVEGMGQWVLDSAHFRNALHGFKMLGKNGVQADYLLPEFPTVTPTNYFSIFTGMRPSEHKIYGDKLFDPSTGKTIRLDLTNQFNTRTEWTNLPFIWRTAAQQGLLTSLKYWRTCPRNESRFIHKCTSHKSVRGAEMAQFVADVIQETTTVGVDFMLIDIDNVAKASTRFGPTSPSTVRAVQDISNMLYELQNALMSFSLLESTNLVLVSDHGFVTTSHERYAFVDDFIDSSIVQKIVFSGSFAWIYPAENKTYQVHQKLSGNLPHCKLHWTNDVPARWHLASDLPAAPLLLLCEPGYGVSCRMPCNEFPELPLTVTTEYFPNALDGYDNASPKMKGIFLARGPDIQKPLADQNFWLRATDVHQLLCRLLKLNCEDPRDLESVRSSDYYIQLDQIVSASSKHDVLKSHFILLLILIHLSLVVCR